MVHADPVGPAYFMFAVVLVCCLVVIRDIFKK